MHTLGNFAILRDFMEIAWYRDHRDKYSSLVGTVFMSLGQGSTTEYRQLRRGYR